MTDKQQVDISSLWTAFECGETTAVAEAMASQRNPSSPAAATLFGLHALDSGDPAAALALFRRALELEPHNLVARLHLVLALYQTGDSAEAARALRATPLFPHRGFLLRFLRLFWPLRFTTELGRPTEPASASEVEARDSLREAFRAMEPKLEMLSPDIVEPPTAESLGGEVARHHRELSTKEGKDARAARSLSDQYLKRGISAFLSGDRALALHCFTRARRLRPSNESAAAHFAWVSLLTGEPEQARQALEPVMEIRLAEFEKSRLKEALPTPDALVCYAWCLHESGEYEDALRVLALVEPEGPEDFGAHFVAGVSWLMLGNQEMAGKLLNIALSAYFIDTWEQIVHPFIDRTMHWIENKKTP